MFGVFALLGGGLIGCYLFLTFVVGVYFWSEDWCVPRWILVASEKRKYLRSLSSDDRRAFLRHERRKADYFEIMGRAQIEATRRRQAVYDLTGKDPMIYDPNMWDRIQREVGLQFGIWCEKGDQWADVSRAEDCPAVPWINGGVIVEKKVAPPVWEPPKWR